MKKALLNIALVMVFLASCTEKTDIELDETYDRLVVDGFITSDTTAHVIVLTKTTSYFYNQEPPPVTGAEVTIEDDLGYKIILTENGPGRYITPDDYYANVGRTYTLKVLLPDPVNGFKQYEAISTVKPIYDIDSIGLAYRPDWGKEGFYEVQCYYQDPLERNFYMFNIYKNGELLTDTINKRFVIDDELYNGNYTNGIGVGYLNQSVEREKLYDGDLITFQAANIEETYAHFIRQLQEESGYQLPLFSGPPANVEGNISNGAIGYFAAYSVAYSSITFRE